MNRGHPDGPQAIFGAKTRVPAVGRPGHQSAEQVSCPARSQECRTSKMAA